jgi:hypothetical protein
MQLLNCELKFLPPAASLNPKFFEGIARRLPGGALQKLKVEHTGLVSMLHEQVKHMLRPSPVLSLQRVHGGHFYMLYKSSPRESMVALAFSGIGGHGT